MTSTPVVEPSLAVVPAEVRDNQINGNRARATLRGRQVTALRECCTWERASKTAFSAAILIIGLVILNSIRVVLLDNDN